MSVNKKNLKTLVAFGTAWGTKFGGINSFNCDFLKAFSAISYQDVRTICVVLDASEHDIEAASREQIVLISLGISERKELFAELESFSWKKIEDAIGEINRDHLIWLGHDRITGGIALAAALNRGGKSALIHHMSYGTYEAYAENSSVAQIKEDEQRRMFKKADYVFAVGPLLRDALADLLGADSVSMLVPGLPEINSKNLPRVFKAFISGRLVKDAKKIKQAHLGIAAFADAIRQADQNSALPDALKGENEPRLVLRGVDFERASGQYDLVAEAELKIFSEKFAERAFPFHALPYTFDREQLFEELSGSTLAMMPSWHEGFGLVAWEAIGAGVPLIVSRKSGVFRLLNEIDDGVYIALISPIDVAGTSEEPFFKDSDKAALAQAIIHIAKNPENFKSKASRLRQVLAERFSWAECARSFGEGINWTNFEVSAASTLSVSPVPNQVKVDLKILELPSSYWKVDSGQSESQLLRAEEAIIPFDDKRNPFLFEQIDWVEKGDFPVAIRLLTGAGGVGKTRLALELCRVLKEKNWEAGFLCGDCDAGQARDLAKRISSSNQKCTIVIDYAETRQVVFLALIDELIVQRVSTSIRIFLLARDGGEWWDLLPSKSSQCESLLAGMASTGPFELPTLHPQKYEREHAYQLALKAFSDRLKLIPPRHYPDLVEPHFSHPLYIQMAALIALRGERPKSAEALTRALVGHERRYWRRALSSVNQRQENIDDQAALLMAIATLANGISTSREIELTWDRAGGEKKLLKSLFYSMAQLYPGRQGLDGWKPDLLGEALVGQVLFGNGGIDLLNAVLGERDNRRRKNTLTVLARVLRNRLDIAPLIEDALVGNFLKCIDDLMQVCIDTPSPLPSLVERAFIRLPRPVRWQAATLLERYVKHDVIPLAGLDVLVSKALVEKIEKTKKNTKQSRSIYANRLSNLSIALERDGQNLEALRVSGEALEMYEKLAKEDSQNFTAALSGGLNTYSNLHSEYGEIGTALLCSSRALKNRRELAENGSDISKIELANSLNSYGACLSRHGKVHEASSALEEAVEIFRKLVINDEIEYKGYLALFLDNLAGSLSNKGRDDDALTAAEEALEINKRLMEESPSRFGHSFARSLRNYASLLSTQGALNEALAASERSMQIYRELAEAKPGRFELTFAEALTNNSTHLLFINKAEVGIRDAEEACQILRKLAMKFPGRHNSELAMALNNYSECLASIGDLTKALKTSSESVLLHEQLSILQPERFEADFASSLSSRASQFGNLGDWFEAANKEQLSLQIYKRCAQRVPEKFQYESELSDLKCQFWNWLCTKGITLHLSEPSEDFVRRDINALKFQREFMAACFYSEYKNFYSAFKVWERLNSRQKNLNIAQYFLLAIVASCKFPQFDTLNWRDDFFEYAHKINGRFPAWMSEVAARAGATWPVVS